MAEPVLPDWLEGLTHKDFLFDGVKCTEEIWAELDWSRAYVDMGPSPAGNVGPYWHVPRPYEDTVHRLYPKVLKSKWLLLIRRAVEESIERDRRPAEPMPGRKAPRNLSAAVLDVFAGVGGLRLDTAAVMAQLRRPYRSATSKQVANSLDYLRRNGRLIRVAIGQYEIADADHPRPYTVDEAANG
jgi:hypothetical protein